MLSPEISIFLLLAVAPVLLIGGAGAAIAFGVYNLDRFHRKTTGEAAATRPAPTGGAATMTLSPVSQMVIAENAVIETAPSLGLTHAKLGMWMFLASEVIFFTALIGAYVAFRVGGSLVVPEEGLNLALASLNTFLLICSSFTAVMALDSIQERKESHFIGYLLATLGFGLVFITIQGVEWTELLNHGVTPNSELFGTAFFVTTGFHGLHVIIGLLWLVFLLLKGFRGDFSGGDERAVENFGLYWHFVDIVWILLFTIIYLIV